MMFEPYNFRRMNQSFYKVHKSAWLVMTAVIAFTGCSKPREQNEVEAYQVKIHQYASPASGIYANAYLVELKNSVVVVDATLINTTSRELKAQIDSLGKPLAAILVTHGHPDHYNGLGNLVGTSDVPIYSTQEVLDVIEEYDAQKAEQWTPMFGAEWPTNRIFPNSVVGEGRVIQIDGVEFSVHKLGPGESHADSYWILNDNGKQHAFIGDAVLHGVHAYMSDGHFVDWLDNISALESSLKDVQMIYPGHGEPGSQEILAWQKEYLKSYILNVEALLGNEEKLTEADKEELVSRMKETLPNDKLEFLIGLGADVVAAGIIDLKSTGAFDKIKSY